MSVWESYPSDYRSREVLWITAAVEAGESAAVVGLSGSGKSNLLGFMANRLGREGHLPGIGRGHPAFFLVDCNRLTAQPASHPVEEGLFQLMLETLGFEPEKGTFSALNAAIQQVLENSPGICLLLDRYDALGLAEDSKPEGSGSPGSPLASNLRALRDQHKYDLTFVTASRRPPDPRDELAELFYAHTLWLGSLNEGDARWNIQRYAQRKVLDWSEQTVQRILQLSGGYPSLLRAVCEAYASGCPLELEQIGQHPAVRRRVEEFWADQPSQADLEVSGLSGHPLLSPGRSIQRFDSNQLTAKEHQLWAYFEAHPNQVCEKDDLIQAVWPEDVIFERGIRDDSLAQLVRRLREKIEPLPSSPQHIHTVTGRGYRFSP